MNDAIIIPAAFGVVGILLSGAVSWLVAAHQISQKYRELLFQRRLEVYPKLYRLLSDEGKRIKYGEPTHETRIQFATELDIWDSSHALLLSPISTRTIADLRRFLHTHRAEAESPPNAELKKSLIRHLAALEDTLKTELGIYDRRGFHNPRQALELDKYLEKERPKSN